MDLAYPEPCFPNSILIPVSEPAVPLQSSSSVLRAMQDLNLSSKAEPTLAFQNSLRQFFSVPTACAVSNGYTGLFVIIKSISQSATKKQIIIPDATMVAVANAVIDNNCVPVLVDNDKDRLNPSAESFIKKVTPNTLAIIVTHTYGVPVDDFQKLVDYCELNNIFLIEDIAEAFGTQYKGKYLGRFGHFASASLYANKLITCGDGGFILSRLASLQPHESLTQYWKCIINHGFAKNYHFNHIVQTGNYRMNGLGAAFVSKFSQYLHQFISKRKVIDKIYRKQLQEGKFYRLMENNPGGENVPWVFAVEVQDKDTLIKVRQHLANFGIQTRPYFKPIHSQKVLHSFIKNRSENFKNSVSQYQTGFYLPTYQNLTEQHQVYICRCLNKFFNPEIELNLITITKTKKSLLQMLDRQQISSVIQQLNEAIEAKDPRVLNGENLQKLKQLWQKLTMCETIQITGKANQELTKADQHQETKDKALKPILLRNANLNFARKIPGINPNIMDHLALYRDCFQYEADKYLFWQKQYNKNLSVEELTPQLLKQNLETIARLTADKLFHFHQLSNQIDAVGYIPLSSRIARVTDEILQRLKKLKAPQLICQVLILMRKNLHKFDSSFKPDKIRIAHNRLTVQKIIFDPKNCCVHLIDFENLNFEECYADLALSGQDPKYFQLNEKIIAFYLQLEQSDKTAAQKRILVHRIYKELGRMLRTLKKCTEWSVSTRESARQSIDRIFYLLKDIMEPAQVQIYLRYYNQNYSNQSKKPYEKKWYCKQKIAWKHHNGGWMDFQNQICQHLTSEYGNVRFISAIEKSMYDIYVAEPIEHEKWCGFVHSVPVIEDSRTINLEYFLVNPTFITSMKNCISIYCLTNEIKLRVSRQFPNVPCQKIYYPFSAPKQVFRPSKVLSGNTFNLLHIGQYLRDVSFFKRIKTPSNIQKIIIENGRVPKPQTNQQNILWISRLQGDKFQELMCESIICLYLKGAGGCTTVLECMARNIPILVNRLQPLEQYLGSSYPLFYDSQDHLEAMFTTKFEDKLMEGHLYLLNLNKQKFYVESGLKQIESGYIYQMIPTPNEEKQQFKSFDISILLLSYKRQFNIKYILSLFAKQSYQGTVQIMIWNNNPQYSLKFLEKQFKNVFANIVVIQSTFNYYAFVRSAAASLARGKYIVFSDDDIFPQENFLQTFYDSFTRLQGEYKGSEVVLTLKGNVFHTFHPKNDINFWTNFDNIHFVRPKQPEQQIDIIHMDTCFMKRSLMIKCAGYQIPELDYILVDDYWYSFVLSCYLNAKLIKIKPNAPIIEQCCSAQDGQIALCMQPKVLKQKNRFFCYHAERHWPITLSKQHFKDEHIDQHKQENNEIEYEATAILKTRQDIKSAYSNQFSGFNIHSVIWGGSIHPLVFDFKCRVVRIGVVDIQKQFLCFFDKSGEKISSKSQIVSKLRKINNQLSKLKVKYILTLGNLPGKNLYYTQNQNKKVKSEWVSEEHLNELYRLWEIIASFMAYCPNCIGYDLINQPQVSNQNLSINALCQIYLNLIKIIRKVDQVTPIILQPLAGSYKNLEPLVEKMQSEIKTENIIYSFHFYEPYVWTSARNKTQQALFEYPGPIPEDCGTSSNWSKNTQLWNYNKLLSIFESINDMKMKFGLADHQLLLGQYGCRIERKGIQAYFTDLLHMCRTYKINRFAYAYRQQWWPEMNYEHNPHALSVILDDIGRTKAKMPFSIFLSKLKLARSKHAQWLTYNPFFFEIKQNEAKKSSQRFGIQIDIKPKKQNESLDLIYIVGCGRSGTTFLLKCLSYIEHFVCLHEPLQLWLDVFPQFNVWSEDFKQILQVKEATLQNEQNRIKDIQTMYQLIMEQTKKTCIVDKQPENVFKLDFLMKYFPKMKVIYLERQMTQVQNSINNFTDQEWYGKDNIKFDILMKEARDRGEKYEGQYPTNFEKAKVQWQQSRKAFLRFKAKQSESFIKNNIFELKFQNIMSNPRDCYLSLAKFLKLSNKVCNTFLEGASKTIKRK